MNIRRRDLSLSLLSLVVASPSVRASGSKTTVTDSEIENTALGDSLQTWLSKNAVAVRSIDAADEDFTDLEPLINSIGSAQVVQLGEPSHGAGSSFAAKVRLIKFLHQRMGFDVLVWESGLYDLELTQAGMRTGEDAMASARRGIFTLWSAAEEVRPLFEYAKASQATTNPLDMAGFDMQVTADGSMERFAADLLLFVNTLTNPGLRGPAAKLADQAVEARKRVFSTMQSEDLKILQNASDGLLSTIRSHRADLERVHGRRRTALIEHAIENMRTDAENRYEAQNSPSANVQRENRRDALNANNLRWLIQERYAGRKIIVWAHNVHVMNAYYASDWRTLHIEPQSNDMKPTGVFLADWLKNDVYTIGMTTYQGQDRMTVVKETTQISPAADGSLEYRLHKLDKPYFFLDVRSARNNPKHPLRSVQSMRIPKYDINTIPDVTSAFDAIFFIDQMAPATRFSQVNHANKTD